MDPPPGRSDTGVKITHYDRHYERHIAAISTCHGHVDVSTTQPSRLLRCRLGIGQTERTQATASDSVIHTKTQDSSVLSDLWSWEHRFV